MSKERKNVKITILSGTVYGSISGGDDYNGDKVTDLIEWLKGRLDEIPKEHKAEARLKVESIDGYDGEHHTEFCLFYYRPETDEEMADRELREREWSNAIERRERQLLEDLKRKYG